MVISPSPKKSPRQSKQPNNAEIIDCGPGPIYPRRPGQRQDLCGSLAPFANFASRLRIHMQNPYVRNIFLFFIISGLTVGALFRLQIWPDVVHLKNGNVLLVDKAWEEEEEIKYRVGETTKSIPKSQVRKIQIEKIKQPNSKAPKYGFGEETRSQSPSSGGPPVNINVKSGPNSINEDVLRRLQENVRSDPEDRISRMQLVEALNSVAALQVGKGELSVARSNLQLALTYDKKSALTLWNLALLNYKSGEYRASEDLLLTLVESDRRNPQFHYLLGEALYSQDKIRQAISEWETALQAGPNEKIARRLAKAKQEAPAHSELGILQSAHFILRYDHQVSDYHLGEQILNTLETIYRQLCSSLFDQTPGTITVVVYPDKTYFDVTQAPRWTGAINDGKIRIPTKGLDSVTDQLKAVLTHELVHSFISMLSHGDCPTWFNEGVAQIQEGKSANSGRQWLIALERQNQLVPLTSLRGSFSAFSLEVAQVAYLEGLSAVEYLISINGSAILRTIFSLMAQNYNFENAFRSATGKTTADFDKEWRESFGAGR